ncbi:MAG: hypothetical protein HYW62_03685 [Candidatus Levybacteria bacterium]|nr:hypothetical protein [Candidatus Levybacteria bacterium]
MKNQLLNKRIPTIFVVGLILLGIVLTTLIVRMQTNLKSNASNSEEPKNVKITNLSDKSFTITYQTQALTTGSVSYGNSKQLGNTEVEDLNPKNIHSISIQKLDPSTRYYLVVISGQNTFLNNGSPFEISTGPNISSPSAVQTAIKGKVLLPDGKAPTQALVYLSSDSSQVLSTTVQKDGEFSFSLKELRTNNLSSYFGFNENTVFELLAVDNSLKSKVSFSLNETGSLPTITLSNDYDFTKDFVSDASSSAQVGFPSTAVSSENLKPEILTPKKDQSFTDQKPQFRGTSLPNEDVEIVIHSDENIQTQVTADSNGNWTYRPPNNLSPGPHTITVKTRDSSGILTTIMQSFIVFAQGSQVSESATPSAAPTQQITPTLIPTLTPTPFPSPTITPTPLPVFVETKGGLPPTGDSSILLIMGGVVSTIFGIALFLLTRTAL